MQAIIVSGTAKEIAALAREMQERQSGDIEFPVKTIGQAVVEAMNDMQKDMRSKSLLRPERTSHTEP